MAHAPSLATPHAAALRAGTSYGILPGSLLPELLGEPDEDSLGAADVAEPIHVSHWTTSPTSFATVVTCLRTAAERFGSAGHMSPCPSIGRGRPAQ